MPGLERFLLEDLERTGLLRRVTGFFPGSAGRLKTRQISAFGDLSEPAIDKIEAALLTETGVHLTLTSHRPLEVTPAIAGHLAGVPIIIL